MTKTKLAIGVALALLATTYALWPSPGNVHVIMAAVCLPGQDDPDAGDRCRHIVVAYRGPAPDANIKDPDLDIRMIEDLGEITDWLDGGPPIQYMSLQNAPQKIRDVLKCACRNTVDAGPCGAYNLDGGIKQAPYEIVMAPGQFFGSGCVRTLCSEAAEVADREGVSYSLPIECRK